MEVYQLERRGPRNGSFVANKALCAAQENNLGVAQPDFTLGVPQPDRVASAVTFPLQRHGYQTERYEKD